MPWHVSCLGLREFDIPYSNAIILKTNIFLCVFFFFLHFCNLQQILNIFKRKRLVIANVLSKLQNVKDLVRPLSKKRRFRTSFDSQHVKASETLVKSAWDYFYQIFLSIWNEIIWKRSPSVKFEILAGFVNTLTADDKYPVPDCENLQFCIQMQLC